MIGIAVIGAGLIGKERLQAIRSLIASGRSLKLLGIFDLNAKLAAKIAAEFNTTVFPTLQALLASGADWIVVALPHDVAVDVTRQALETGSRVIMEKPMGRDLIEGNQLLDLGKERLFVGFNYRFYGGIAKAMQDWNAGRFGRPISVDFLLGHGCFPGQEKTWKLDDDRAGGGCLIDPGVHLLDICNLLAPSGLTVAGGTSWKGFWNTGVEEDVSLVLDAGSFTINLRVSIVHWRSVFQMAVNGTDGYCRVNGRNRSYGNQSYTCGPRWGWQGATSQVASEAVELETDGNDTFILETRALLWPEEEPGAGLMPATASEAFKTMSLLDAIRNKLSLRRNYG